MLLVKCPACEARYNVNPGKTTKTTSSIKCPACQHVFSISLTDGLIISENLQSSDSRPKVLIVDDSRTFRGLISDLLKPLKLNILTAVNGNEALQIIAREHPQLVILDLVLPDISGVEIVRKIKSFRALNETKFLILSGTIVNDTPPPELSDCPADDFSAKSFKPEQLQKRIVALLNK